jgi:ABC-type uncharacterized transport system ATPase subunit
MGLVLGSCDQVVVLDSGSVIATGTPAQIRGNARVVAAYLGRSSEQAPAAQAPAESKGANS